MRHKTATNILLLTVAFLVGIVVSYDLYFINKAELIKPYNSYWKFNENLSRVKKDERALLIVDALQKFQEALSYDPENPEYWRETGRLYLDLSDVKPSQSPIYLTEAASALTKSIQSVPCWGWPYFDLARIYYIQDRKLLADQAMAYTQILYPNNHDLCAPLLNYWSKRYQVHFNPIYIPLIIDRFYLSNQFDCEHYLERSLEFWENVTTESDPWGNILPQRENYALAAARYFLSHRDYAQMQRVLDHVVSEQNMASRYLIEGNACLYKKDIDGATALYKRVIKINRDMGNTPGFLSDIIKILVRSGYLEKCIPLLQATENDNIENRLILFEYAISLGIADKILPLLKETEHLFPLSSVIQERFEKIRAVTLKGNK